MGSSQPMVEFAGVTMVTAARDTLKLFLEHPKIGPILKEKDKRGGFVCFAEDNFGVYATVMVGSHPRSKPDTFSIVQNKVNYLLDNPGRTMSREGRNPQMFLWGGGIRIPGKHGIIAFSGFPEHLDELFVMVLAIRLKLMTPETVKLLLQQYPNEYVQPGDGDTLFI